ncbi:hypothetical protein L0P56_18490, partial [Anaerosalibacter bizertensis]|nr:hypothetical protein [Anaerosalibacter bizertensis]
MEKNKKLEGGEIEEVKEETKEIKKQYKPQVVNNSGNIKIHIGEGKDINIEIPYPITNNHMMQDNDVAQDVNKIENEREEEKTTKIYEDKEIRKLKRKYF